MKIVLSFIAVFLFSAPFFAQSQTIRWAEYEKVDQFAVSETNADYPLIFKVTTYFIENGKTVRTETEVNENEAPGRYRIKRTALAEGKETNQYQITAGFGIVYCSEDGVAWDPPTEYECPWSMVIYRPRKAESVEYSVDEKLVEGKKVKVYRKYSVFAPLEPSTKKDFRERISTIDSRGFFITVEDTEGTLDPRTVILKREQSWITKAKIKPVVPPIK